MAPDNSKYHGLSNYQVGVETLGGRLYLTDNTLDFIPHKFNVQKDTASIPLSSIKDIKLGWTKFLGFIPLFPNAVIVIDDDQKEHTFTVYRRNKWIKELKKAGVSID